MKRAAFVLFCLVILFLSSGGFALAIPTINVLSQTYTASAAVSGGPSVTNTSSVGPVTAGSSSPPGPQSGSASAIADGSTEPTGGFLGTTAQTFSNGVGAFGEATATMDFSVTELLVFSMRSFGSAFDFGLGRISLVNLTDNVTVASHGLGFYTDNPLLEVGKQYRLQSYAQAGGPFTARGNAKVDFNVPEPASFWLLLPALGLIRSRLVRSKK